MKAFTDGACRRGNPGQTSCAWAIFSNDGHLGPDAARYLGPELHSNNYAEFQGLLDLLKFAYAHSEKNLEIFCDSKLVVNTVNQAWQLKEPSLVPLRDQAYALMIIGRHTLEHVHGHSGNPGNEYVDKMCNEALDKEEEKHGKLQKPDNALDT